MTLPEKRVVLARKLRASGMAYPELANFFGVSQGTVRYWLDENRREKENERFRINRARKQAGAAKQ